MGTPHTIAIAITTQYESRFVTEGNLAPFHILPNPSCASPHQTRKRLSWVSLAAHLIGAEIPDVLQPGYFVKTQ
ncbi:hypothetical protein TNCV_4816131 [Trichonephila clavipes]|nr:hypothetical protein TNCV_4816131 [Trichonephila clavipes]